MKQFVDSILKLTVETMDLLVIRSRESIYFVDGFQQNCMEN